MEGSLNSMPAVGDSPVARQGEDGEKKDAGCAILPRSRAGEENYFDRLEITNKIATQDTNSRIFSIEKSKLCAKISPEISEIQCKDTASLLLETRPARRVLFCLQFLIIKTQI